MMIVRPLAIALLIGIFALIFIKRVQIRTSPRHAAAACCALLAWWPLASPLFWTHYFVYFVPFWGWLIAEGLRSRARMAMAVLIIGSMWVCISGIPALPLPELLESHMFIAAMLLLGYAIWFLARRENVAA